MDENVPTTEPRPHGHGFIVFMVLFLCLAGLGTAMSMVASNEERAHELAAPPGEVLVSQQQEVQLSRFESGDLIMLVPTNPEAIEHLKPSQYCVRFISMKRRDATSLLVDIKSYDGKTSSTMLVLGTQLYVSFMPCL